jgi:hypothetical protein
MEDRGWRTEDGGQRMEDRGWRMKYEGFTILKIKNLLDSGCHV